MFQFSMKDRYHFAKDIVLLEIERRVCVFKAETADGM